MSVSSSIQIIVWQPCRFRSDYLNIENGTLVDGSSFHEVLYTWETSEDIFGSITQIDDTEILRSALLDNFAPERTPDHRSIQHLITVLELIDSTLAKPDASQWGGALEDRNYGKADRISLRQHRLLAFRHHLQWIFDTFSITPGANLTIR